MAWALLGHHRNMPRHILLETNVISRHKADKTVWRGTPHAPAPGRRGLSTEHRSTWSVRISRVQWDIHTIRGFERSLRKKVQKPSKKMRRPRRTGARLGASADSRDVPTGLSYVLVSCIQDI